MYVGTRIKIERLNQKIRNEKVYTGYLYNRGYHQTNGYSIFNRWLYEDPFADPYLLEEKIVVEKFPFKYKLYGGLVLSQTVT